MSTQGHIRCAGTPSQVLDPVASSHVVDVAMSRVNPRALPMKYQTTIVMSTARGCAAKARRITPGGRGRRTSASGVIPFTVLARLPVEMCVSGRPDA